MFERGDREPQNLATPRSFGPSHPAAPANPAATAGPAGRGEDADNDPVDRLEVTVRELARVQARLMSELVAVADAAPVAEFAVMEIMCALTWTRQAATGQLALAEDLVRRLPAVHAALACGDLDLVKARVLADGVVGCDRPTARRICAVILPQAGAWTTGQLRVKLAKLVIDADPDAAALRHTQAVAGRRVVLQPEPDSCASLHGLGLPAADATAAANRLSAMARAAKQAGDPRSMDQIRADSLLDLLLGRLPGPANGTPNPGHTAAADLYGAHRGATDRFHSASGASAGSASAGGASAGGASAGGKSNTTANGTNANGTNASGTNASGTSNTSATGTSASNASASGTSASGPTVGGASGTSASGATVGGASGAGAGGASGSGVGADDVDADSAGPGSAGVGGAGVGGAGGWRGGVELVASLPTLIGLTSNPGLLNGYGPVIADIARQVAAQQHTGEWTYTINDPDTGQIYTGLTRRRPDTATARHIRQRDRTCRAPGCRVPARRTDIDHTTAIQDGGLTHPANLGCLCRWHHRAKHEGGWTLEQPQPGVFTWRSPTGRTYQVNPDPP